jgi:hypothetical protein
VAGLITGVFLIACGVAAAIALSSGDEPAHRSERKVVTTTQTTTAISSEAPPNGEPAPAASRELTAGRYVRAGTYVAEDTAAEVADRLSKQTGLDVFVIGADQVEQLIPGFQVLLIGPEATSSEDRVLKKTASPPVSDAFLETLEPAQRLKDLNLLAGRWADSMTTSDPETDKIDHVDIEVTIAPGGRSGTIDYAGSCRGRLSLEAVGDTSARFTEQTSGDDCPPAGAWLLKPAGAGLGALRTETTGRGLIYAVLEPTA